jgi:hypothetical protein
MTAPRLVIGGAYTADLNQNLALTAELNMELSFDGKRNVLLSSNVMNMDPRMGLEIGFKELLFGRLGIYNFQQALEDADITNLKKVWIYQPGLGVGFKLIQSFVHTYFFIEIKFVQKHRF